MLTILPKTPQPRKGFTLIELLIAIAITAVLATVGITIYSQGQKLARDVKRKSDLKQIQNALALYQQDNKAYPAYISASAGTTTVGSCRRHTGGYTYCTSNGSQPWINGLDSSYINTLPQDPVTNASTDPTTGSSGYGYRVYENLCGTTGAQVYLLYAKLENTSDPDRLGAKSYDWCGGGDLKDNHSFNENLFVVGSYL